MSVEPDTALAQIRTGFTDSLRTQLKVFAVISAFVVAMSIHIASYIAPIVSHMLLVWWAVAAVLFVTGCVMEAYSNATENTPTGF